MLVHTSSRLESSCQSGEKEECMNLNLGHLPRQQQHFNFSLVCEFCKKGDPLPLCMRAGSCHLCSGQEY